MAGTIFRPIARRRLEAWGRRCFVIRRRSSDFPNLSGARENRKSGLPLLKVGCGPRRPVVTLAGLCVADPEGHSSGCFSWSAPVRVRALLGESNFLPFSPLPLVLCNSKGTLGQPLHFLFRHAFLAADQSRDGWCMPSLIPELPNLETIIGAVTLEALRGDAMCEHFSSLPCVSLWQGGERFDRPLGRSRRSRRVVSCPEAVVTTAGVVF